MEVMQKEYAIVITTGTLIRAALVVAAAALLWYLRDLVLIVLTSIVIGSAIDPAARALSRYRVPRVVAILVVYVAFFMSFFAIMYFFIPPVLQQTTHLLTTLPTTIEQIDGSTSLPGFVDPKTLAEPIREMNTLFAGLKENTVSMISTVFGGLLSFVLVVVFSFYFAVNERGVEEFLRLITPLENERFVVDLWHRSQKKIGLWLQGQLLLGLIVGVLVFLGLTILGVPYALVLAVAAALLEIIPVFGPFLAALPAVALAFATGGLTLALAVAIFYLIVQQFENNLIYPLVVTKVVGVPPLLVILALIIGGKLAGVIGVLLSIPMAAVAQELFAELDKRRRQRKRLTKTAHGNT